MLCGWCHYYFLYSYLNIDCEVDADTSEKPGAMTALLTQSRLLGMYEKKERTAR